MMRYGTAETILAGMFGAGADARDKAFRGRLKHLKRLGIPLGSSPGKGAKIMYDDEQVYQWAICLQLAECGLDPTVIVEFVRESWGTVIWPKLKDALRAYNEQRDWILIVSPHVMTWAWAAGLASSITCQWKRLADMPRWNYRQTRPAIVINASAMAHELELLRVRADSTTKKGERNA